MALTGYSISTYKDVNPYSPTYGQTRTVRELDTEECTPPSSGDWRVIYDYCEIVDLDYTGYLVSVYQDVDPNSPTYGESMERRVYDEVTCPLDSSVPIWEMIGSWCEQVAYQPSGRMGNTGYKIEEWKDVNEYSDTYGQVEQRRMPDTVGCEMPDTSDVWVIQSRTCHQVESGGMMVNDGTMDIVRINTNEYSPNYNFGQPETINVQNLEECPLADTSPDWVEQTYTCVLDEGYRTGDIIIVEEDVNPLSSTYGQQRTRTERDTNRCPVQPKPTDGTIFWKIVNNRSVLTDTIRTVTVSFNDGLTINAVGTINPAGGELSGTTVLEGTKKTIDYVASTVTISPNATLPTQYQWVQSPNPYNWSNDNGATVLTITLQDGDGTAPVWTETSYSCDVSAGYNTGQVTVVEEDTNPLSGTYGQTRTRTYEDLTRCPLDPTADWQEISYTCQLENGFNTGYAIVVQKDMNPTSPSYNTTRNVLIEDTTRCPLSTTAAWTEVSYVCEQQDGFNTGNIIVTERDVNPGSATYNQTRTRTLSGDSRCVRDTSPSWVEISYECEQSTTDPNWEVTGYTCETSGGYNTGNKIITETDTNPYSATYNQTRTSTVVDRILCPINAPTPDWREISYTCEQSDGENTGTAIVVEQDMNSYSPTYGQQRTVYELDTERCPLPTPSEYKLRTVSSDSTVTEVQCDSSIQLRKTEIADRNCVSAVVGSCVEVLYDYAFQGCTSLVSVTLAETVRMISTGAFSGCTSLTNINLPNAVSGTLGDSAFKNCSSLTSITIPSGVTLIGNSAFQHCSSLTSVTCLATTPPTLRPFTNNGTNYYYNFDDTNNCPIYVPSESVDAYKRKTGWTKYASRIQAIPNS